MQLAKRCDIVPRPEIHQHQTSGTLSHHVLRLHVTMQQACRMHGLERVTKDGSNLSNLVKLKGASPPNFLLERLALNQFHP